MIEVVERELLMEAEKSVLSRKPSTQTQIKLRPIMVLTIFCSLMGFPDPFLIYLH